MLNRKKFGRPRLLIIGCGDVGLRLLPLLIATHRIFALTSDPARRPLLRAAGAVPIVGNLDALASLRRLRGLATDVVHLAPPAPDRDDDPRTRRLLAVLSYPARPSAKAAKPMILPQPRKRKRSSVRARLIYASTSGVYGDCGGVHIDETRPVQPFNKRARRRVAAEHTVRSWGRVAGRCAAILRIPGIYAAQRLPLARLTQRIPALRDVEDVYTNHVHADDLAAILRVALFRAKPQRVYHASDNSEMKMGEYFDAVADWAGLPRVPRIAAVDAPNRLTEIQQSFMRESRRLDNRRLRRELRVRLRYATVGDFLATCTASRTSKRGRLRIHP